MLSVLISLLISSLILSWQIPYSRLAHRRSEQQAHGGSLHDQVPAQEGSLLGRRGLLQQQLVSSNMSLRSLKPTHLNSTVAQDTVLRTGEYPPLYHCMALQTHPSTSTEGDPVKCNEESNLAVAGEGDLVSRVTTQSKVGRRG
jgi:hypothetical protein